MNGVKWNELIWLSIGAIVGWSRVNTALNLRVL
jgi:hypothetical protein